MKLNVIVYPLVLGSLAVAPSYGQSLGDVARLQAERLKTAGVQTRTYTNADLKDAIVVAPAPVSPPPTAASAAVSASEPEDFSPARYGAGALPPLPPQALGSGQIFLELTVGSDGRVTSVTPLRTTPPFTDLLVDAVTRWSFLPAEKSIPPKPGEGVNSRIRERVESKVLVAGHFRPPALYTGTIGEVPRDTALASLEVPLPLATIEPLYSPGSRESGLVLAEVEVDRLGAVGQVNLVHTAGAFDVVALAAARQWRFRPARVDGQPVNTLAYIVFGFPAPIGIGPPPAFGPTILGPGGAAPTGQVPLGTSTPQPGR